MDLTPQLLGAAQPETVKPTRPPLPTPWCTQKPTKCCRRDFKAQPWAYRTHHKKHLEGHGVHGNKRRGLWGHQIVHGEVEGRPEGAGRGLQSKLKGPADGPGGSSTQTGALRDKRQREASAAGTRRSQRSWAPLKGGQRPGRGRSVPKQVGSDGSSSSEAGFAGARGPGHRHRRSPGPAGREGGWPRPGRP